MAMPEFHALVNEAKKEIQEINSADLKQLQQSGEDIVLIDVREKSDADNGMIPDAVHLSRGMLEHDIDKVTTDKNKKLSWCFIVEAAAGRPWLRHP